MKKVRLVLASPTHKKMRESLIFFQTWKKCSARSFWQRGQTRHEKIEISKNKLGLSWAKLSTSFNLNCQLKLSFTKTAYWVKINQNSPPHPENSRVKTSCIILYLIVKVTRTLLHYYPGVGVGVVKTKYNANLSSTGTELGKIRAKCCLQKKFHQIIHYLVEQCCKIVHNLAEQFCQIARYLAEHQIWTDFVLYSHYQGFWIISIPN